MTAFVVPFGTLAVAAHSLTQQIDMFINIAGGGFSQAAAILAGQNLGARQPDKAARGAWLGVLLYTSMMVVGSIILWFWGSNIISLFNNEPGMVAIGANFVRIQIITYLCFGFASVLQQCLNGVGDTIPTMIVTLVSMFVIQVPLAYVLSKYTFLGVYGTRWAIAIGTVCMAIIYVVYFRMGRWKKRGV
jgi:Na+-driven multidrug efflux pump